MLESHVSIMTKVDEGLLHDFAGDVVFFKVGLDELNGSIGRAGIANAIRINDCKNRSKQTRQDFALVLHNHVQA
jgi:hypothetical protein